MSETGPQLTLAPMSLSLVWNLQGDPARAGFMAEVERRFGMPAPTLANTASRGADATLLWIGPKSWLWVAHPGAPAPLTPADFERTRDALNRQGGALFDISAGRVAFCLRGEMATTVLAKGCPLDLHARAFAAGHCAQSVLGRVNALIYKRDEVPTFVVMVARSFEVDVRRSLCLSAEPDGVEIVSAVPFGAA